MIWSDYTIQAMLRATTNRAYNPAGPLIDPMPHPVQIQPATVDLRLGALEGDGNVIPTQTFRLGCTIETVTMPPHMAGIVMGKSTWARRGLIVEAAGFIDPGFSGQITLELFNMHERPITVPHGAPVCQIMFLQLDRTARRPYGHAGLGSHYQGQQGPTPPHTEDL